MTQKEKQRCRDQFDQVNDFYRINHREPRLDGPPIEKMLYFRLEAFRKNPAFAQAASDEFQLLIDVNK
jgi:hypothetical protein